MRFSISILMRRVAHVFRPFLSRSLALSPSFSCFLFERFGENARIRSKSEDWEYTDNAIVSGQASARPRGFWEISGGILLFRYPLSDYTRVQRCVRDIDGGAAPIQGQEEIEISRARARGRPTRAHM